MNGTTIKIRGYHCDAYGHVNNARYLELLEESRWAFLEPAIEENFFESRNLLFVVVEAKISYKQPLVPGDIVEIELMSVIYNNKSAIVHQEIRNTSKNNGIACFADITFVLLNSKSGRPETFTDETRLKFDELMEVRND